MIRCCTWVGTRCKSDYPDDIKADYRLDAFPYYEDKYNIPELIDENPPVTTVRYFGPQVVIVGTCLHPTETRWHEAMCACKRQWDRQEEKERNERLRNRVKEEARKDDMVELDSDYI